VKEARLVGEGIVIAGEDAIVSESIGRHIEGKGLQLDGNGTCRFGARTGLAIDRSQKQGVPRCDHTALLLYDYAIEHFGLWVLKCLPKLVVLPLLADPETRIVVSAELPEKFVTLMMDLGVERERIVFHNPSGVTEFRRLVVPPKIYTFGSSCLPNPFEAFRYDQTPPARSPMGLGATPNRRIYVTRLGNERRRLINEHEVEGLFAESGFQIVEPSKLTGAETLSLFANCEIVAGAFGSGLYNLLFSRRASQGPRARAAATEVREAVSHDGARVHGEGSPSRLRVRSPRKRTTTWRQGVRLLVDGRSRSAAGDPGEVCLMFEAHGGARSDRGRCRVEIDQRETGACHGCEDVTVAGQIGFVGCGRGSASDKHVLLPSTTV
jgi:hypothetical protein